MVTVISYWNKLLTKFIKIKNKDTKLVFYYRGCSFKPDITYDMIWQIIVNRLKMEQRFQICFKNQSSIRTINRRLFYCDKSNLGHLGYITF